jgi:hypothetical protein
MLRIFAKRPRLTPSKTFHEQTGMKILTDHASKAAHKNYFKSSYKKNK